MTHGKISEIIGVSPHHWAAWDSFGQGTDYTASQTWLGMVCPSIFPKNNKPLRLPSGVHIFLFCNSQFLSSGRPITAAVVFNLVSALHFALKILTFEYLVVCTRPQSGYLSRCRDIKRETLQSKCGRMPKLTSARSWTTSFGLSRLTSMRPDTTRPRKLN